jgi:hypothetical protein
VNIVQDEAVYRLLENSFKARELARNARSIREILKRDRRRVLPVAFLSRQFSISVRLLWKWIAKGIFEPEKIRPKARLKPGIGRKAALDFLGHLEEKWIDSWEYDVDVPASSGRPVTAVFKIQRFRRFENHGDGMTPREFAELVGVSRSSVMRAIEERSLDSWNPTPCRYRIGRKPRIAKKSKFTP